ncbi:type II secretion system secretin GspD [Dokdonella sp.]|uniref:type II secretion system secretin GspD n=1 Tax=Dokdonella sp. TaxID=2291710 RepID=UPI0025C53F55|nr:type II secretion system secretin GspD [Dokdonella sp.]MBX3687804.1 type II secretion system secretin GspD [Dokdonella sp.]
MNAILLRLFPLALCGALFAAAVQAQTNSPAAPAHAATADGRHTLNLKDADIQALIATVSEITGKNFIVGPNVQGKVTVVSARPMKPDEIYDVFLSVLRVHGYAAVPSGSMVKIVPDAIAQTDAASAVNGNQQHAADELVTEIVPVKHVSAAELVPILRPLMAQSGQLIAHASSNSLVISDRAGNVERLKTIVSRIDTVSDAQVEMIPLTHANAAELARTLTALSDDKAAQANGEAVRVFADTRTNSILLAGAKNGRLKMRALIAHLDTPVNGGGDTQVIYLHYARAKDLVPILQGVATTLSGMAPPNAGKGGEGGGGASASTATIQAHEETNSLVVSAPPAVFRSLANVVRELDIRRNQVLIEAVIAEVADQTASELGVQWQMPLGKQGQHVIGGTNFTGPSRGNNIFNAAQNPLGVGNGFNLGYIDGTVSIGGHELFQIGALLTALRGDGKSNILSTPSVLTLDNQEAEIKVAKEVPFLTGQYTTGALGATTTTNGGATTTTGITNPFQTIERKDVGLVLKVKPMINVGDSVRLDIHQEVSSLLPPVAGAVDLVTNKRELTTSVLVQDGALLVLGGLIDTQQKDNVQKVPALGDIPLLGNLFRYRSNDRSKTDLMVFLHPKILRDAATEAAVSSEKYNYMRTEQLQMRQSDWPITPREQRPMLPEVHDFLASPALDASAAHKPATTRKP